YELVAKTINENLNLTKHRASEYYINGITNQTIALANAFEKENPRFNRSKFLAVALA
ncbi:uncharacterized protein METZ01_LOCUS337562, partial [marine metagenome]